MGRSRSRNTPGASLPASDFDALAAWFPDLDRWPQSWMVEPRDLAPGQQILECLKPFLRHLVRLELSRKTVRRHCQNLWCLGGELISELHNHPARRRKPVADLLREAVADCDGGPLLSHSASADEQRSFDATCRKLGRFLAQRPSQ